MVKSRPGTSPSVGPFRICSTVHAARKVSCGSSLGVSRKHCGVPAADAASDSIVNTRRSLAWSMPWLISSTTRNGQTVTFCARAARALEP